MRRRVFVFASRRPPAVCSEAVVASVCRSESAQPAAAAQAARGRPRGVTQAFILRRRRGPAPQSAPDVSAAESSEYRRAAGEQTEPSAAEGAAAEPSAPPGADRGGRRPSPSPGPGPDSSPKTVPDRGRCRHGRGSGGTQPRRRPLGKRGTRRRREPSPAALPAQGEPADGGHLRRGRGHPTTAEAATGAVPVATGAEVHARGQRRHERARRADADAGTRGARGAQTRPERKVGTRRQRRGHPRRRRRGRPADAVRATVHAVTETEGSITAEGRVWGESPADGGVHRRGRRRGGTCRSAGVRARRARGGGVSLAVFRARRRDGRPITAEWRARRCSRRGGRGGDGEWFRKHHGTRKGGGGGPLLALGERRHRLRVVRKPARVSAESEGKRSDVSGDGARVGGENEGGGGDEIRAGCRSLRGSSGKEGVRGGSDLGRDARTRREGAPSLADALGEVEADAHGLGPGGDDTARWKFV